MPEFIQNNLTTLILIAIIVGFIIYQVIKYLNNRKAAASGEDLKHLQEEVGKSFPDQSGYQMVYAHYEHTETYGRTTKTTYYRYVVAFQGETMWVFPMGRDKKTKQIQVGRPATYTPDDLGKISASIDEKDGTVKGMDVELYNKSGESIVQFRADATNLRKTKFYPVNLLQPEACQAFRDFITPLAQRVAGENTELEAQMQQDAKESYGTFGIIISVIGAIVGLFFAPVGLLICVAGLAVAARGAMKGAKKKTGLIVSGVCVVLMLAWTAMWLKLGM